MFDLIQELTEARMFKGSDTLVGKSAEDVAKMAFSMLMMLEIIRNEDERWAKSYVNKTMPYTNFDSMRTSASDLHNLLAVLNNQDKYSARIKTNPRISVPVLGIRRYFREVEAGRKERGIDRSLFISIEDYFKITDSNLKKIRRNVADWWMVSDGEKQSTKRLLKNILQSTSHQADIYVHFKNTI